LSPRLVLASGSPRRREFLDGLGLRYEARPPDVDETPRAGESPSDYVGRVAEDKALAAGRDGELVIAADTTVVVDGDILGKPDDEATARAMLARLAGRWHEVLTAVAVAEPASRRLARGVASTQVLMSAMTAERIAWYVGTGEPLDRAGAYAIQGLGALLVEQVRGNYTNVVGLPLPLVERLCAELGYDLLSFRA
jgi:nucleoside triphosphate pyrophosphatase